MNDVSPFDQIELTTMLANYAQVADGMINVMGAGWTIAGGPSPSALAGFANVPYNMANTEFTITAELLDIDGNAVIPHGEESPLVITIKQSVSPSPMAKRGQHLTGPFAIHMGPLPIPAGRYEWRFSVNGRNEARWNQAFTLQTGVLQAG